MYDNNHNKPKVGIKLLINYLLPESLVFTCVKNPIPCFLFRAVLDTLIPTHHLI